MSILKRLADQFKQCPNNCGKCKHCDVEKYNTGMLIKCNKFGGKAWINYYK